jgi:hypothetical protein
MGNALATGFTPFAKSDEIPADLTGRAGFRQDRVYTRIKG